MGCTVAKAKKAWIYWTLCSIFCLASPIGIGIGIAIQRNAEGVVTAMLSAFCGGTLFFVGSDEIIAPALAAENGVSMWKRMLALWLGFAGMAVLAKWA